MSHIGFLPCVILDMTAVEMALAIKFLKIDDRYGKCSKKHSCNTSLISWWRPKWRVANELLT